MIQKWRCKDCSIGEKYPCEWFVFDTGSNSPNGPVSCPYGTCGEDAVWEHVADIPIEQGKV